MQSTTLSSTVKVTFGSPDNITIPLHKPLRVGTLNNILKDVAQYLKMSRDQLVDELFGQVGWWGMDPFDALHVACAEQSGATFLTTDDTLIKVINKHGDQITIEIKNPVQWFMEVTANGSKDVK